MITILTSHILRLIIYISYEEKRCKQEVIVLENKTIGRVRIIKRLSNTLDSIIFKLENYQEIDADDREKLLEIRKFLLNLVKLG
jgi:hypothetical protein